MVLFDNDIVDEKKKKLEGSICIMKDILFIIYLENNIVHFSQYSMVPIAFYWP